MPLEEASAKSALVDKVTATLMDSYEEHEGTKVTNVKLEIFATMARAIVDEYLTE